MNRIWTRIPWQPQWLLALAVLLAVVWAVSMIVGGPSTGQSLICDVGGSCTAVYVRGALAVVGSLAGLFALILIAVGAARWVGVRRRGD